MGRGRHRWRVGEPDRHGRAGYCIHSGKWPRRGAAVRPRRQRGPNEALLISGSKRHKDATQFRIVTGHGSFVVPVKQRHQAELAAQRLEAEVRRPADAEANKTRTLAEAGRDQARFATEAEAFRKRQIAEADRDQARLAAEAEAYRQTTLAESEAKATRLRADARAHAERCSEAQGQADANQALAGSLREGNQELIAASKLIENLPALAEAAARGLAGANLTVLNGTQGVNEVVAGLIGQGMSILDLLKKSSMTAPATAGDGTGRAALDKIAQRRPRPRALNAGKCR